MPPVRYVVAAAFFGLAACRHAADDSTAPKGAAHEPPPDQLLAAHARDAVNARVLLVVTRCQRELRCGTLGNGKRFSSVGDCERAVDAEWAGDMVAYECKHRELGDELQDCLEHVHDQDCDSPFDTIARISACTPRQVCLQ